MEAAGLPQPLNQVIGHPNGIRNDGKGRVDRPARRKEGAVDDVKIVQIVGAAIEIEHRLRGITSKPARPILMPDPLNANILFKISMPIEDSVRVARSLEHIDPSALETLERSLIIRRVFEPNRPPYDSNPIVRVWQIFGHQPPRHSVVSHHFQREARCQDGRITL